MTSAQSCKVYVKYDTQTTQTTEHFKCLCIKMLIMPASGASGSLGYQRRMFRESCSPSVTLSLQAEHFPLLSEVVQT